MGKSKKVQKKLWKMKGSVTAFRRNAEAAKKEHESHDARDNSGSSSSSTTPTDTSDDDDAPLLPNEHYYASTTAGSVSSAKLPASAISASPNPLGKEAFKTCANNAAMKFATDGMSGAPVVETSERKQPTTMKHRHRELDEIQHPYNAVPQEPINIKGGFAVHAWRRWECCQFGKFRHYESHVCSFLQCCHKRCEAHCTTLKASNP